MSTFRKWCLLLDWKKKLSNEDENTTKTIIISLIKTRSKDVVSVSRHSLESHHNVSIRLFQVLYFRVNKTFNYKQSFVRTYISPRDLLFVLFVLVFEVPFSLEFLIANLTRKHLPFPFIFLDCIVCLGIRIDLDYPDRHATKTTTTTASNKTYLKNETKEMDWARCVDSTNCSRSRLDEPQNVWPGRCRPETEIKLAEKWKETEGKLSKLN